MGGWFMLKEDIEQIINKSAGTLGYEIYESIIYLHGKNSKITVKIDSLNGIKHEDCEKFSREFSANLDSEAFLPDYVLEVSSPGLDRKVRSLNDFIRFIGSPVKFTFEENEKRETLHGIIKSVENSSITITIEKGEKNFDFDKIIKASLDF
jgi:ribosome maturation factor RimP